MKKRHLALTLLVSAALAGGALTGCAGTDKQDTTTAQTSSEEEVVTEEAASDANASSTEESGDAASAEASAEDTDTEDISNVADAAKITFIEERTGKDSFASYDEIIDQLQGTEGYAYLSVAGHTGYVLAVAQETYGWDETTNASISVDFFAPVGYIQENSIHHIGSIETGGTGYPIRCSEEGILYGCNSRTFGQLRISDQDLLCYSQKIDLSYDEDGNATVSGYYTADDNMEAISTDIDVADEDAFYALFDDLEEIPVINFKLVEQDSYDNIISQLPENGGYAYIRLDGYEGDILAITDLALPLEEGKYEATSIYFYAMDGEKAVLIGDVNTGSTASPVRLSADGTLYAGSSHIYNEAKVRKNGSGSYRLYYSKYVADSDAAGSFTGFIAQDADTTDNEATAEDVQALNEAVTDAQPIEFQTVSAK